MVLSNKKLKQKRRAECAQKEGNTPPTDKELKGIDKREKKRRHLQQLDSKSKQKGIDKLKKKRQLESPPADEPVLSEASAIDQAELDAYRRCIETILSKRDQSPLLDEGNPQGLQYAQERRSKDADGNSVDDAKESMAGIGNCEQNILNAGDLLMRNGQSPNQEKEKISARNAKTDEIDEKAAKCRAKDQESVESRTVYVGGIPYYSSEDDIRAFFGDCGTISEVNLKTFSDSGKFRGIALLTFKTLGGVQRALALDGSNMGDRFLKIQRSTAKPTELVPKEVHSEAPTKTQGYMRAYVGNLSWNVTEEDIRYFFEGCNIDRVKFSEDKVTGAFQGFGHIDFADDESLEKALQLNQRVLLERPIKIAYAVPSKTQKRANTATRDRKDIICHTCGEKGHISSSCPYMGRGR